MTTEISGNKIRLYPTAEQEQLFHEHVISARKVWNIALAEALRLWETERRCLSGFDFIYWLPSIREQYTELQKVSNASLTAVLRDLAKAFTRFRAKQRASSTRGYSRKTLARAARHKVQLTSYHLNGHPKFKSWHSAEPKFPVRKSSVRFKDSKVHIEKIGWVSYRGNSSYQRISNPRVQYTNGKWLMTFGTELDLQAELDTSGAMGIDLGIKTLAVVSCRDGVVTVPNINKTASIRKLEKRRKRAQRKCSRRTKGANRRKAQARHLRISRKITNKRNDHIHKTTRMLVNMLPKVICLEDLGTTSLMQNKRLARSIQQAKWREFRTQIEYKARRLGILVVYAPRTYPSSKTCSRCGFVNKELTLSHRTYICPQCDLTLDRDLNAAINLKKLAEKHL